MRSRRWHLGEVPSGSWASIRLRYPYRQGQMTPIVYDAAFSGSSHGKIRIYEQKGMRLPEGWVTRPGRPTDDRSQGGDRRPASPHRRVQRGRAGDDHGRPFVHAFRCQLWNRTREALKTGRFPALTATSSPPSTSPPSKISNASSREWMPPSSRFTTADSLPVSTKCTPQAN